MDAAEAYEVARAAVEKLAKDRGSNARFPFDAIWSYADTDVPSPQRPGPRSRLVSRGFIEATGRSISAESGPRAGSPTNEYRLGPALRQEDNSADELARLSTELYLPPEYLRETIDLLSRKRQLIFYGPPGTGKTYMARALARYLTDGDEDRLEVVQFHPSYSYEDFVQGYRPALVDGGNLTYKLVDGPLLRLAERAGNTEETCVLFVDEVNRGNVPRIFGELLYLLEYRDQAVSLLYQEEPFELPENLWLIGTMNTADRSIGLIDAALRRRFHFRGLFPDRPPIDHLLSAWIDANCPEMSAVVGYVETLNRRLRERFGEQVQIGPSYFMDGDLDDALLRQIWDADILPFLEEQLFGHTEDLSEYSLESIQELSTADRPAAEAPGDANDLADGA
jgi:5-methylcytosine-specific restriction protein B